MNEIQSPASATPSLNAVPVHVVDRGRVRASVWENIVNDAPQHKVTLTRSFKRGSSWHRGRTFYADELSAVLEATASAQRWIERRRREPTQPELATA